MLGNLIDNAVTAAVAGTRTPRWVEVAVLDDGDALVFTVADSGAGLRGVDPLSTSTAADGAADERARSRASASRCRREIARRSGGDLWVIDPGDDEHGAVFAARLGGAVDPARAEQPARTDRTGQQEKP